MSAGGSPSAVKPAILEVRRPRDPVEVEQSNPLLGVLTGLLNLPKQNCPQSSQDPLGGG